MREAGPPKWIWVKAHYRVVMGFFIFPTSAMDGEMKVLITLFIFLTLLAVTPVQSKGATPEELIKFSSAFFTNLAVHEYGHAIVGSSVGGEGISVTFFSKQKNNLFLGYTSTKKLEDKAYPSFALGGEIGANLSFEYALQSYRKNPTTYNKALLFFSGTDFLWYSLYTFYLNNDNPDADPNILVKETGINKDMILSIAMTQSLLNGYRVVSGKDRVVPYFTYNKDSIGFHVKVPF